jgi:hypothetical protein
MPFRWVPIINRREVRAELLLNASPSRHSNDLWMFNAGILVDFAKEILAVNELQRPAPK